MVALDWLYYILLLILCVVGLFINILGLPGLWLMVAAYGAYWWATASRDYVGVWSAIIIRTVSFSTASLMAMVPDNECKIPTLMVSSAA